MNADHSHSNRLFLIFCWTCIVILWFFEIAGPTTGYWPHGTFGIPGQKPEPTSFEVFQETVQDFVHPYGWKLMLLLITIRLLMATFRPLWLKCRAWLRRAPE